MSGSSNLDSFCDGWYVAVQLLLCGYQPTPAEYTTFGNIFLRIPDVDICLQGNLIELQRDRIFHARFKDKKHSVRKSNNTAKSIHYFGEKTQLYFPSFLSSYLVGLI